MFGNRLGWFIAVVIALLMAVAGWRLSQMNDLTPVTDLGAAAEVYEPLRLPMDASVIVPMDRAGDGGAPYRAALEEILRNLPAYQAFAESGTPDDFAKLAAMKMLVDATSMQPGEILAAHSAVNVGYQAESDELKALLIAGHGLGRMGLLASAADAAKAKPYYRAEFALGAKLLSERISFYEAFDGIGLMQEALDGLRLVAIKSDDKRLADVLGQFNKGMNGFVTEKLEPMQKMLGAVDGRIINAHAGDVYAFTGTQMNERMWRIEAILKLGRHKFNAARLADQAAVLPRLAELKKNESDPAIVAAIDAAQGLTLEQYRMIR